MSKTTTNSELNDISADDLALWSAVIVIIGDLVALLAVLKARSEKQ
ncbi:hypothetical protein [Paenibacillus nasutitermitis]|uniref:Uncharacterized protein n=1 Tax=Paenibacillus nasutitermitis TaxID=1652958 RepID=A0A916YLF3_9BACL|nr:hypothetical protein [Paenibacillus nasutitermitis]GGD51009.1 hypothetical protein GCM10010911_05690 [Paenibacillus nasutitermitis]